jgi:glycosyltransferase involved in cell wall biosynthesis
MSGLIVHEWIESHGGSENVVEAMASAFPDADISCLWNDAPGRFPGRSVKESWLARTPLRRNKALALPFMPATWSRASVKEHDFVLVSSHLFAHHVGGRMPTSGPKKFVYVHTPARYIWAPELDARGQSSLARAVSPVLKAIDVARAGQGAVFAANSEFVRDRIERSWHQDSKVIFPPVNVEALQSIEDWRGELTPADEAIIASLPGQFVLGASRFVPYKRLDIAIQTGEAVGLPVVLAGSGPQRAELLAIGETASVPVRIVDRPSDALLYALYQAATALIFPAVEDFGIMPVEAIALGTPVIVGSVGGAAESVVATEGGVVVDSFDASTMDWALQQALTLDMVAASRRSSMFSGEEFKRNLRTWMINESASVISTSGAGPER